MPGDFLRRLPLLKYLFKVGAPQIRWYECNPFRLPLADLQRPQFLRRVSVGPD